MRIKTVGRCLLTCAIAAGMLLTSACSSDQFAERASSAALVPGADFVAHIDLKAMRSARIIEQFEKERGHSGDAASQARYAKFQETTGLTDRDVLAVVISADADSLDLANLTKAQQWSKMVGAAAIALAKPLDTDKLLAGLRAILDDGAIETISKVQLGGLEAVVVKSAEPGEPTLYAAPSSDARTVYLALNQDSLQATLQRAKDGQTAKLASGLQAVADAASQASVMFVAPEALRAMIRAQLAQSDQNPGAAMVEGLITPFKDLQSLSLGLFCDTGIRFDIASDLGQTQAAGQVATLIQTMALPMLKGLIAKSSGKMPTNLEDKFKVLVDGSVLRIRLSFAAEELLAYQKTKAAGKTAAAF